MQSFAKKKLQESSKFHVVCPLQLLNTTKFVWNYKAL
jgi:hypothetical protein